MTISLACLCLAPGCTSYSSAQDLGRAEYLSGRLHWFNIRLEPPGASERSVGGGRNWKVLSSSSGLTRLQLTSEPAPQTEGRYVSVIDFKRNIRNIYYFRTERLQSGVFRKDWVKVADLPNSVIEGIECSGTVWETPHADPRPPHITNTFHLVEEWRIATAPLHYPLLTIKRSYMNGTLHSISVEVLTQLKAEENVSPEIFQLPPPKSFWDQ